MTIPTPKHPPLPEGPWTRSIVLRPGKPGDPLVCTIEEVDLDVFPVYEAISYRWDTCSERVVLYHGDGMLSTINASLATAMSALRSHDRARVLWADEISIDQTDLEEKATQITLMSRIFGQAKQVVAWLGEDDKGDAKPAYELLASLNNDHRAGVSFDHSYLMRDIKEADRHRWKALAAILARPWFTRVWMIQEVGLAQKCVLKCGAEEADRSSFYNIGSWLLRHGQQVTDTLDIDSSWSNAWLHFDLKQSVNRSFLALLDCGRQLTSTDARDHIYAFLGHPCATSEGLLDVLRPDYTQSAATLYTKFARHLLLRGDLRVLSAVQHFHRKTDKTMDDLPYWVPDWSLLRLCVGYGCLEAYAKHLSAATRITDRPPTALGNDRMVLHGAIIDTVRWTSDVINIEDLEFEQNANRSTWSTPQLQGFWHDIWDNMSGSSEAYPKSSICDVIAKTMVFGCWKRFSASDRIDAVRRCFTCYKSCRENIPLAGTDTNPLLVRDALEFSHHLGGNRRLFKTSRGYLGNCTMGMRGDLCCVIFGAPVLFLLRRPRSCEKYWLIGECYLEGYMHGEAIDEIVGGILKEQEFVLE